MDLSIIGLELISEDRQTQRVMMNLGAGLHRSEAILEPIKLRLGSISSPHRYATFAY